MTGMAIELDQVVTAREPIRRPTFAARHHADDGVSVQVKSAGRVFRILELFDEVQCGLRVSELAEKLGFPQSSTSALLKCMVQIGYLDCDPISRTYIPSARVAILGSWLDRATGRSDNLLHLLEALVRRTGHTVVLAVRNGLYSRNIHVLPSSSDLLGLFPRGSRQPLIWSETGYALLSAVDNRDIRLLCTRTNAERSPGRPLAQIGDVLSRVQQVRDRGYFVSRSLLTPGVDSISTLLPCAPERRVNPLAVGIAAPQGELVESDIVNSMEILRRSLGAHA